MLKIKNKHSLIISLIGVLFFINGLFARKIIQIIVERDLNTIPVLDKFLSFFVPLIIIIGILLILNKMYIDKLLIFFKKNKKELILLFVTIILCLIIIEIVLERINYIDQQKEKIIKTSEYEMHVKLNSDLFRDDEFYKEKENNTFRILLIGDSFVYGATVEKNETFEYLLEKKLSEGLSKKNETYKKVEIFNLGKPGYNTRGYLDTYKKFKDYNYDLVILILYADNDFTNYNIKIEKYYKIYSFLDNFLFKNIRSKISLLLDPTQGKNCEKYKKIITEHYLKLCENDSINWNLIEKFLQYEDYNDYYDMIAENFDTSIAIKTHLSEFKKISEEKDVRLMIFTIPGKYQVNNVSFVELKKIGFKSNEIITQNRRIQDKLLNWCNKNSVECYDLLPYFKSDPQSNYYRVIDDHLNKEGNIKVTEYIESKIYFNETYL